MPAGDPAGYAQNIGRSAMGLNPVTGMMDMAQQGGQAIINSDVIQMLMQLLGGQQAPMPPQMGNPISGVGVGGMQGNIPLKQKMVR